jgi:photosystem II stability/assembly factor-like uncharacterized protein
VKKPFAKKIYAFIIPMVFFISLSNAQWLSKPAGFSGRPQKGIDEMIAVDANTAWALAYERNKAFLNPMTDFTRTIDGGNHWIEGNISAFPDQVIVGIAPLSATKAYVISCDENFVGKVLKTMNGGITWSQLNVAPYPMFYQNIYFFNNDDGVIYGDTVLTSDKHDMVVFLTHNGGKTWSQVPDANLPSHDITENWYLFSSTAIGKSIWSVSTKGRVWKSTDKGVHWIANSTPESEAVVSNIKMRDAVHGLWGINDELYRTSDGGITWVKVDLKGTFFTFDLSYVPGTASTWISTGGDTSQNDFFTGALHGLGSSYSTDDGNTWITIDTGVDHLAIAMVNVYTGFCGGFNSLNGRSGVFDYRGPALGYACGNDGTLLCHNGQTICVAHNSIAPHLAHGDNLGKCVFENNLSNTEIISKSATDDNGLCHLKLYPNPSSNSTTISFTITQSQKVSISIFDMNGRLVKIVASAEMQEGAHQLTWNASGLDNGIYYLKFNAGHYEETKKLVVIK